MRTFLISALVALTLLPVASYADTQAFDPVVSSESDEIVEAILSAEGLKLEERLDRLSGRYLGRVYQGGPLGEGADAKYDADPLVRFDVFDCTTYVETVMALAYSHSAAEFLPLLNRIRYAGGEVSFPTRNHFTDLDWNPNLVREGYLEDITASVARDQLLYARALIDKPAWYAKMGASSLQGMNLSGPELEARVLELRSVGLRYQPEEAVVPYLPLTAIHTSAGVDTELLSRIPSGTLVNLVRPNWDLVAVSGTRQNISHQGLLFRKPDGGLYMRHASSGAGAVADVLLSEYLRAYLQSPTLKGIQLLKIRE